MSVRRTGHGFGLASNGKLYAAGGSTPTGRLSWVEECDPATNSWRGVASLPTERNNLRLPTAGDCRLFAVAGGTSSGGSVTGLVQAFIPPRNAADTGSWAGPSGIARLPAARTNVGLIGAPNGKLYAIGGSDDTNATATVFEYDPAVNAWSSQGGQPARPPIATARIGPNVGLVGGRLFVIAGSTGSAPLASVEEAILTDLPSAAAGGRYTATAGGAIQLTGAGSDPEGEWRLVCLGSEHRPALRDRRPESGALGERIDGWPTRRPPARLGPGQIRATLTAGQGAFSGLLRIGQSGQPLQNATVDVQGGPSGHRRAVGPGQRRPGGADGDAAAARRGDRAVGGQ